MTAGLDGFDCVTYELRRDIKQNGIIRRSFTCSVRALEQYRANIATAQVENERALTSIRYELSSSRQAIVSYNGQAAKLICNNKDLLDILGRYDYLCHPKKSCAESTNEDIPRTTKDVHASYVTAQTCIRCLPEQYVKWSNIFGQQFIAAHASQVDLL